MEVYEEVGGNAFDACNASDALDATTTREENLNQPAQIEGVEAEGNQLVSLKALKATSGNAEKRLRKRQEMHSTIGHSTLNSKYNGKSWALETIKRVEISKKKKKRR